MSTIRTRQPLYPCNRVIPYKFPLISPSYAVEQHLLTGVTCKFHKDRSVAAISRRKLDKIRGRRERLQKYRIMPRTRSSPAPAPAASTHASPSACCVYACFAYACFGSGDCTRASSRSAPGGIHPLDTAGPTATKTPYRGTAEFLTLSCHATNP